MWMTTWWTVWAVWAAGDESAGVQGKPEVCNAVSSGCAHNYPHRMGVAAVTGGREVFCRRRPEMHRVHRLER